MTTTEKLERLKAAMRRALAARREHSLARAELRAAIEDAYGEVDVEEEAIAVRK